MTTTTLTALIAARDALEELLRMYCLVQRCELNHPCPENISTLTDKYAALAALRDAIQEEKLASSMNLTLSWDGNSGDGKRAFVLADQNDGWKDLRIEVDTDDCDSKCAITMMEEVIRRVNALNRPPANTSEGRT